MELRSVDQEGRRGGLGVSRRVPPDLDLDQALVLVQAGKMRPT